MLDVQTRTNLRERVSILLKQDKNFSKNEIVKHFKKEGISTSTCYKMIYKIIKDGTHVKGKRTGRPSTWTTRNLTKLKGLAKNKVGTSQIKLSKVFGVSHQNIGQVLAKIGLSYTKRKKVPKYSDKQLSAIPGLCRKLLRTHFPIDFSVILDDEKYFGFSGDETCGNRGFYTDNYEETPDNVKFKQKLKFAPKILVWVAISVEGISEPFILEQASTSINQNNYLNECIKKKLVPFINKHHSDRKYIFWPDKASAHYAKTVLEYMDGKINFLPKSDNPPNIPQARPIERFWALLEQQVYMDGWQAENRHQLALRIKKKLREFPLSTVRELFASMRQTLRLIGDHGPLAAE